MGVWLLPHGVQNGVDRRGWSTGGSGGARTSPTHGAETSWSAAQNRARSCGSSSTSPFSAHRRQRRQTARSRLHPRTRRRRAHQHRSRPPVADCADCRIAERRPDGSEDIVPEHRVLEPRIGPPHRRCAQSRTSGSSSSVLARHRLLPGEVLNFEAVPRDLKA